MGIIIDGSFKSVSSQATLSAINLEEKDPNMYIKTLHNS